MVQLTRLNNTPLIVNSDLIRFVEQSPDTVITLVNGEKILVRETPEQVVHRILLFRRAVLQGLDSTSAHNAFLAGPEVRGSKEKGSTEE